MNHMNGVPCSHGHHKEKVSDNPDKMTDPRTIEFKKQEDHIKYHQQNGY